jgi:hypothetical protein
MIYCWWLDERVAAPPERALSGNDKRQSGHFSRFPIDRRPLLELFSIV